MICAIVNFNVFCDQLIVKSSRVSCVFFHKKIVFFLMKKELTDKKKLLFHYFERKATPFFDHFRVENRMWNRPFWWLNILYFFSNFYVCVCAKFFDTISLSSKKDQYTLQKRFLEDDEENWPHLRNQFWWCSWFLFTTFVSFDLLLYSHNDVIISCRLTKNN